MKPNWNSFTCGLKENGELVASALGFGKKSRYGFKMAYIPAAL